MALGSGLLTKAALILAFGALMIVVAPAALRETPKAYVGSQSHCLSQTPASPDLFGKSRTGGHVSPSECSQDPFRKMQEGPKPLKNMSL